MTLKLYFIRHGMTAGNREHRYVGCTDEPILAEAETGLLRLKERLQEAEVNPHALYVSPMLRCRQTAELLFPQKERGIPMRLTEAFRECDFGAFEYRNYQELDGNPDYQRFIDTNGESGFPGGETLRAFQRRCVTGFKEALKAAPSGGGSMVFVIHGGAIMAILDAFSRPHRDYYDWQTGNGVCLEARLLRDAGTGEPALEEIREF